MPRTIGQITTKLEQDHDAWAKHCSCGCRLDAQAANMVGCYYNAHRPQDGQWLPADSMPKTALGQPIAFVALGAHGLYTGVSTIVLCSWMFCIFCSLSAGHRHLAIVFVHRGEQHCPVYVAPVLHILQHNLQGTETLPCACSS